MPEPALVREMEQALAEKDDTKVKQILEKAKNFWLEEMVMQKRPDLGHFVERLRGRRGRAGSFDQTKA